MTTPPVRIRIFYPADPLGVVPGGVDTFLRGLIKFAPADLEFSLVGMTTDSTARPVGQWSRCQLGSRVFDFFPVVALRDAGARGRVPLSVRFSGALWRHASVLRGGFDVFDFHRLEPSLLFEADGRPKNTTFHNDPQTLGLAASDNLWKHAPGAYRRLEKRAMTGMSSAWCVRESGVQALQQRYPAQADRIRFIPTWVDAEVFAPVDEERRTQLRRVKAMAHGLDPDRPWVISVGRLDTQKNPALLLRALQRLRRQGQHVVWLVVGDGVLRAALERQVAAAGMASQVCFLGLLPPTEIADWLRACNVYALSSAYEGMPMALLEALGCGLPAAVTDVGEVRRVVTDGVNGAIAAGPGSQAFAAALARVIAGAARLGGAPALAAAGAYRPADVLVPAFDNYRALGLGMRTLRLAAEAARDRPPAERPRTPAVGIPIDALCRETVVARLLGWAEKRESRYVCFVNVHSSMHAAHDERHRLALLGADLAAPDGAPIAWTVGAKGGARQQRVDGPGTMWRLCVDAARLGIPVGLYGASAHTSQVLESTLRRTLPQLRLAYVHAPPFRELSAEEDAAVCADIERAGVGLLFVGLGCPKQERWMAAHRSRVSAVMLGVGAAFEFHAGTVARAPGWMREGGLEWLHRLGTQPRRLGRRYLHTNTLFLARTAREMTQALLARHRAGRAAASEAGHSQFEVAPREMADTVFEPNLHEPGLQTRLDPRPFENLVSLIDAHLPSPRGRLIGFIASGGGEGTTTMARAYVAAAAARLPRRVLLLETQSQGWGSGVMQALAQHRPLHMLMRPLLGGGVVASLGGADMQRAVSELATRVDLWEELRRHFDDIVLDLPAACVSTMGLALAAHCDGVVVVLEAGKTRAPVVQSLVADLQALQANVLGTVLNKRRFHVPARVYRWL